MNRSLLYPKLFSFIRVKSNFRRISSSRAFLRLNYLGWPDVTVYLGCCATQQGWLTWNPRHGRTLAPAPADQIQYWVSIDNYSMEHSQLVLSLFTAQCNNGYQLIRVAGWPPLHIDTTLPHEAKCCCNK